MCSIGNYRNITSPPAENIVKEINIREFANLTNNVRMYKIDQTTSNYLKTNMTFHPRISHLVGTYAHLKNLYTNKKCGFLNGTAFVEFPGQLNRHTGPGPVIGIYQNVIALGHWNSKQFAHWIYDTLSPLMLIPKHVRDVSSIIVSGDVKLGLESLMVIGFRRDQLIVISENQYVFAYNLHVVYNPTTHNAYWSTAMINLSKLIYQKLELSTEPPSSYVLLNRPVGKRRNIHNFDLFVDEVKKTFPENKWIVFPDPFSSFAEAARMWCDVRVIFSPTGSNLANMIFMKPYTAVCNAQADRADTAVLALAQTMTVYLYCFSIIGMVHFGGIGCNMNISAGIEALNRTIFVQKNGFWS